MENYVGKLQEIMVKVGIEPIYKLSEDNPGAHINAFKMRLTCQVRPGGPTNSVYGEGLSKKAAKQAAAKIFLQKYLDECNNNNDDDKNDNNIANQMQKPIDCVINVNSNRINLLQMICAKNGFEKPEYFDVLQAGPSHSPKFTVACNVGLSRTEGEGSKKTEARLKATDKMIKFLMEEQNIYEVFQSSNPKSDNNYEIVCLIDHITGARTPNPFGIFGKRLRGVSPELENRGKLLKSIPALMRSQSAVRNTDNKLDNSVSRSLFKGANNSNFEIKVLPNKKRSKSLINLSYRVYNKGASTNSSSSEDSGRTGNHLQAISEIDKALENVESQLYKKIRDTMEQKSLKVQKKVTILSNEFDIFINHNTAAKITDGSNECTDESIRIACLSKLLMDLKEYALNKS